MSANCPFDPKAFNRHFNHHAPEFGANREQIFDDLRERCPVARTDAFGGYVVLTRYEDIVRVARDDATFSSEAGITVPGLPTTEMLRLPIGIDPPRSFKYRNVLMPFFRASWLKKLEPWVNDFVDERIDTFIESGKADLQSDLAHPLTANFIMHMTGLPREQWWEYSMSVIASIGAVRSDIDDKWIPTRAETTALLSEEIERQRQSPRWSADEKVLPYLLQVEIDGRKLTHEETLGIMELLLDGGFDTTMAAIGHSLLFLYRNHAYREQLIDQPGLMPGAVEEFLRWVTPQQGLFRTATKDVEVGGVMIKAGERVFLAWSAANRDPQLFALPHEVNFDRPNRSRHLSFGIGAHLCLGLNVARLELGSSLSKVLQRLPDYVVNETGIVPAPGLGIVNGIDHLPVTFTPGKRSGIRAL
ncbi:MAG: cytochrome P450 [Steroidobacteraceae bacterium]